MVSRIVLLLIIAMFSLGAAAQDDGLTGLVSKAGENAGPTLALIIAMYWLRDMSQRRIEESARYASEINSMATNYTNSLDTVIKSLMKGSGQNGSNS